MLRGILSVTSAEKTEGIGGLGRIFPGPGSCEPGTNTNLLFSISGGKSETILANAWNDCFKVW